MPLKLKWDRCKENQNNQYTDNQNICKFIGPISTLQLVHFHDKWFVQTEKFKFLHDAGDYNNWSSSCSI